MKRLAYFALFVGAFSTAGYAMIALFHQPIQSPVFRQTINNVEWSGRLHILAGALALGVGLFQLSGRIRAYSVELHRNLGRGYVGLVLLSTIGAMISLPSSSSTLAAKSAFWFLAVLWPIATIAGYPFGDDFSRTRHARFMVVSYALTCSAISLRLYLGLMLLLGFHFEESYAIAAWAGIITNLLIVIPVVYQIRPANASRELACFEQS